MLPTVRPPSDGTCACAHLRSQGRGQGCDLLHTAPSFRGTAPRHGRRPRPGPTRQEVVDPRPQCAPGALEWERPGHDWQRWPCGSRQGGAPVGSWSPQCLGVGQRLSQAGRSSRGWRWSGDQDQGLGRRAPRVLSQGPAGHGHSAASARTETKQIAGKAAVPSRWEVSPRSPPGTTVEPGAIVGTTPGRGRRGRTTTGPGVSKEVTGRIPHLCSRAQDPTSREHQPREGGSTCCVHCPEGSRPWKKDGTAPRLGHGLAVPPAGSPSPGRPWSCPSTPPSTHLGAASAKAQGGRGGHGHGVGAHGRADDREGRAHAVDG